MQAHGQATVWGTLRGARLASDAIRWSQRLRDWWAAYASTRRHAKLAALNASWDAQRESLKPPRVEAAPAMAAAQGALSMATQMYGLTLF
jgi:hypothetical protein